MCDTCGCNVTDANQHLIADGGKLSRTESGKEAVTVLKGLLSENDHQAAHNRGHFDKQHTLALNLMSSPGAGKTALLEATIQALGNEFSIAVVEGDLETENDAARIRQHGIPAVQISTGSACHLDAHMVHDALHALDDSPVDILFIENVGNLVCPASFDLGQHHNITLLSVPEGDDKPAKYPVMFRAADVVLLSKTDLLPILDDFDPARSERYLRELASDAPFLWVSNRTDGGLDAWLAWLRAEVKAHRERLGRGESRRPAIQPDGAALHQHEPGARPTLHHAPMLGHRHG